MEKSFWTQSEREISEKFLRDGYVIAPLARKPLLEEIRKAVADHARKLLGAQAPAGMPDGEFLDSIHRWVAPEALNAFRVDLIKHVAGIEGFRETCYALGKEHIDVIVGNELSMQRACNMSIQMPNDVSSLLPLHSDVWSGNSPYEIVFWLPIVDCFKTKSMYVLPRAASDRLSREFPELGRLSSEELFKKIEKEVIFVDVPFGHAVFFAHSIVHGNRLNVESTTRWTFNVRFKGLLTPYGGKDLGESFLPITLRPITRMGSEYVLPECR